MARVVLFLLALSLSVPSAAAAADTFEVGAAKASTNPAEGQMLCLGGYGSCPDGGGRTMTGIRDDLHARALAVSADGKGLILVHTTNVGFFAGYKDADGLGAYSLRQQVAERTGVPAGNVIVQADHSHSGPDSVGIWGGVPQSYLRFMQAQAVEAAADAWAARRPARVYVGQADGKGVTSSYESDPNLAVDETFLLLWADDRESGERIATWTNYSPHATVLPSSNKGASGDWPEWASVMAEEKFGGGGIASVGTVGREDFGEVDIADAHNRLRRLIDEATAAGEEVPPATGVDAKLSYIHEPMGQPILALNHLPEGSVDMGGYDLSIDRDTRPPFLTGTVVGTFAGAARIGDVFIGLSPGESFPQLQFYLRDERGVDGARAWFHLGATNDFLGYMLRPLGDYPQVFTEGAGFLLGCPEEEVFQGAGIPFDGACPDHWTLMVSPTIGSHVTCSIQNAALAIGFTAKARDEACPALTATDGVDP